MSSVSNPVLQDWVMTLNWKEQTGLISAIRGLDSCDIDKELDRSCKKITRMIRFLVLNNVNIRTGFMTDRVMEINKIVDILNTINSQVIQGLISLHWFDHIFMAIKIIIDKHPNAYIRMYWYTVYDKYNTSGAVNVDKVILKEVEESNLTMDDIKNMVSEIETGLIRVDALTLCGEEEVNEIANIEMEDIGYPIIDVKDQLVTDTTDCEDYSVYQLEFKRFIDGRKVTYNCINATTSTQKTFKDMIKVIPQLDAILTDNWCVVNDTMSSEYKLDIPVTKGSEMRIKDSKTDRFMVANLTRELLYKDLVDAVWVINGKLMGEDILKVTVVRDIRDTDAVVYDLIPLSTLYYIK